MAVLLFEVQASRGALGRRPFGRQYRALAPRGWIRGTRPRVAARRGL